MDTKDFKAQEPLNPQSFQSPKESSPIFSNTILMLEKQLKTWARAPKIGMARNETPILLLRNCYLILFYITKRYTTQIMIKSRNNNHVKPKITFHS